MATKNGTQRPQTSKTARYPNNKRTGKKQLPEPTHLGHFISILVMSLCKKILHMDTAVKIGLYLCGVLVGSVISDVFALPKSFFSDKKNILNRIFVASGFGWTIVLLSIYIFLTSFVYTCGDWKTVIRKHLSRLVFATVWWIVLTKSFVYIDSVVGVCSLAKHKQRIDCLKAGKAWLGFDVSGHVFLLIHNLLTISEEVKSFKCWTALDTLLKEEDLAQKKSISEQEVSQARISYKALTPYIKIVIIFLTIWMIFCEFMLIISIVHRFHTLSQKVTAAFLAIGCWFLTYKVFLETKVDLLPSQPGYSKLNYMKKDNKQG